jgi:hypothetical protein
MIEGSNGDKITRFTSPVRWATHLFSASSSASVCKTIIPSTSIEKNGCFLLFSIVNEKKISHLGYSLEKVVIKYYILDKLIITISLDNGEDNLLGKSQLNSIKY